MNGLGGGKCDGLFVDVLGGEMRWFVCSLVVFSYSIHLPDKEDCHGAASLEWRVLVVVESSCHRRCCCCWTQVGREHVEWPLVGLARYHQLGNCFVVPHHHPVRLELEAHQYS